MATNKKDLFVHLGPINLIRGGWYVSNSGGVRNNAYEGYLWLPRIYTTDAAFAMLFNSSYFSPNYHGNAKGNGYSLRCLVR